MSRAVRTLYRLFFRQAKLMDQEGLVIDVHMPMDKSAWMMNGGSHGWAAPAPAYIKDTMRRLLPWLSSTQLDGTFTAEGLRQCVRDAFRHPAPPQDGRSELLDRAFTSLRILGEQIHMARCSSSETTNSIRVDVTTAFVGNQAELDPTYDFDSGEAPRYYFTYRVRISNVGSQTVQLLSRHWIVRNDENDVVAEVAKGSRGVVGCTPILKPATCFSYYSGTDLETQKGCMEGSFELAVLNAKGLPESSFEARIAPFRFLMPEHTDLESS